MGFAVSANAGFFCPPKGRAFLKLLITDYTPNENITNIHSKHFAADSPELSRQQDQVTDLLYKKIKADYQGEALSNAQDAALKEGLRLHGAIALPNETGVELLQRTSNTNLRTHLGKAPYQPGVSGMATAEKMMKNFRLQLQHNSRILKENKKVVKWGALPLLSSRELEHIGLNGGLNSGHYFNKHILKTDDQVYFLAVPTVSKNSATVVTEFGENALLLKNPKTLPSAWISPYVMYMNELADVMKTQHPEIFEKIYQKVSDFRIQQGMGILGELNPEDVSHFLWTSRSNLYHPELVEALIPEMTRARNVLSNADFTVADFEHVLRNQFLHDLNRLRISNPDKFRSVLKGLPEHLDRWHDKNYYRNSEVSDFIESVYHQVGYSKFEGKVPVAVSPEHLIHQKR